MSKYAFILILSLSLPAIVQGEDQASSYASDVLGACKAEVKDHCHDKNLKKGEVTQCLKEKSLDQKNKFTNNCRDSLAKKK
jgi:hypothetical protein